MRAKQMHDKNNGFRATPVTLALLFAISLIFGACGNSDPSHKVIQMTKADTDAHFHSISLSSSGRTAWVGEEEDGQSGLYLYPGSGIREIRISNMDYASLMVNDAGQVVWQGFDGNDAEIFFFEDGNLIQVTNNDTDDAFPWINNAGQVVWTGSDGTDLEIFLYENGAVTQITDNKENDTRPQINDAGQILWWGARDGGLFVLLYDQGTVIRLSPRSVEYYDRHLKHGKQINNSGQAVWTARIGGNTEIFWFDGTFTSQITDNAHDDIHPVINQTGQIVWQGYDGNDFEIFLFNKGNFSQITDDDMDNTAPDINAQGQVVWQADGGEAGSGIYMYYPGGKTVKVSAQGVDAIRPDIGNNGWVAWVTRTWEEKWRHTGVILRLPASVVISPHDLEPLVETLPGITNQATAPSPPPEGFSMGSPANPLGMEDPFTFVVMGDSRGKDISWVVGERLNKEFLRFMADKIVNDIKPDLTIFTGDMDTMAHSIIGHHYLPDWMDILKPVTDAGIPLYVTKGNHEMYTFYGAFRKSYQDEYQNYFSNMHGITSLAGYENLAFSFEYGNSYFVVFDSFFCWKAPWYKIQDYHYYGNIGDTQLAWLKEEAARAAQSGATHRFVLSHGPVFSAEGINTFANMNEAWKTFCDNDFDIYFAAHEHIYCRKVIDADPDAGYSRDLAQIVSGAGISTGSPA